MKTQRGFHCPSCCKKARQHVVLMWEGGWGTRPLASPHYDVETITFPGDRPDSETALRWICVSETSSGCEHLVSAAVCPWEQQEGGEEGEQCGDGCLQTSSALQKHEDAKVGRQLDERTLTGARVRTMVRVRVPLSQRAVYKNLANLHDPLVTLSTPRVKLPAPPVTLSMHIVKLRVFIAKLCKCLTH